MEILFRATTIGTLGIAERDGSITNLFFQTDTPPAQGTNPATALLKEAFYQLDAYLAGALRCFTLPLAPAGTDFMRAVWKELCKVPYGTTTSYKAIATALGKPGAMRAVGMANNRNPLPLFIPCHRIIGATGKLVGYAGGLELKKKLLALEAESLQKTL